MGKKSIPFLLSDEGAPFAAGEILVLAKDNGIKMTLDHVDLANKVMSFLETSYDFSRHKICGPGRKGAYVPAKIIFAYFMLTRSDATERLVGCLLGGRDHSTIINMLNVYEHYWIDDKLKGSSNFRDRVRDLRSILGSFVRRSRNLKNLQALLDLEDEYCGPYLKPKKTVSGIPNILSVSVPDAKALLEDFMLFNGHAKEPDQMAKVGKYINARASSRT